MQSSSTTVGNRHKNYINFKWSRSQSGAKFHEFSRTEKWLLQTILTSTQESSYRSKVFYGFESFCLHCALRVNFVLLSKNYLPICLQDSNVRCLLNITLLLQNPVCEQIFLGFFISKGLFTLATVVFGFRSGRFHSASEKLLYLHQAPAVDLRLTISVVWNETSSTWTRLKWDTNRWIPQDLSNHASLILNERAHFC